MREDFIVYDVEVARLPEDVPGGWENPQGMGFASAVTYSYLDDQYRFWLGEDALKPLVTFLNGARCVTFNGIKFDSRVLLGNDRLVEDGGRVSQSYIWWDNADLLLEYVKTRFGCRDVAEAEARLGDKAIHDGSFGLDGLAVGTLGLGKTGHGAKAPKLYQGGEFDELLAYNLHDVRLTRKLFEFAQAHGYLVDAQNRVVRIRL